MIDSLMTLNQLAVYLAISPKWIYRHTHEIPHTRVGVEYRFRKSEVDLWLEATRGGVPLRYLEVS